MVNNIFLFFNKRLITISTFNTVPSKKKKSNMISPNVECNYTASQVILCIINVKSSYPSNVHHSLTHFTGPIFSIILQKNILFLKQVRQWLLVDSQFSSPSQTKGALHLLKQILLSLLSVIRACEMSHRSQHSVKSHLYHCDFWILSVLFCMLRLLVPKDEIKNTAFVNKYILWT